MNPPGPGGREEEGRFKLERLQTIRSLEREHFWFLGRRELILRYLRKLPALGGGRVLDLGSGTGHFLEELARSCGGEDFRSIGLDFRVEGLLEGRQRFPAMDFIRGDAERLPFEEGSFDLITAFDVLEHLDDRKAIPEIRRALRQGGHFLATVPIGPWLYSYRDRDAGHRRRYRRKELFPLLEENGLRVRSWSYYQFTLFPLLAVSRCLGKNQRGWRDAEERLPPLVNRAFAWINRTEARCSRYLRLPYGSSLVVCCKKESR